MYTYKIGALLILIFGINYYLSAQISAVFDTANVQFKAKLLTLSTKGISDGASIISEISSQPLEFLETGSNNIVLMKISFNQHYYLGDTLKFRQWIGKCNFYVAYNIKKYTFYRLGGFSSNDAEDFIKDLDPRDYTIFDLDLAEKPETNFFCIAEYAQMKPHKRVKKRFDCLYSCDDKLKTEIIISKK